MSRFPICTHWRWQLSDLVFPGGRNRCCTKSRTEALSRASIRLSRPFRRGQASTVTLDEGPSLRHALVRRPTVRRRTHRVGGRPVGGGPRRAMGSRCLRRLCWSACRPSFRPGATNVRSSWQPLGRYASNRAAAPRRGGRGGLGRVAAGGRGGCDCGCSRGAHRGRAALAVVDARCAALVGSP